MHIEELQLSGFGHFFERRFGPFDSPITVFVGPNEAGKSTLLAFIRAALFGFPQRSGQRFYPALRGGEHGGRLRFRDTSGRRYVVDVGERARTIRDDAGLALDLAVLQRALGHASRDVFESVFAFGLDELQDMKSLDKEEAARYIFAAGTGAARVPAAIASFTRARDELFKPQGRNPQISRKLAEI